MEKPGRSSWFAREGLPQCGQPVERSSREWAYLNRGESVLELLRRRHADQDGAHRRVRQRKPRGGFGQAGGEPLLYQRDETARAIEIGIVAHGRTNRLRRRTSNRVTLG